MAKVINKSYIYIKHNLKTFLVFAGLAILTFILQAVVYENHLKYGFRDGDWWLLYDFYNYGSLSLDHLVKTWQNHGIYTYQIYYIGFANSLVGLDFPKLYQIMHISKLLATLSIFPLILTITKSRLSAFLTTIIFSVGYPIAGAMFMYVTGGYFLAIISMSFFFISYKHTFDVSPPRFSRSIVTLFLLLLTLFLNTERMYILLPLIPFIELFWLWRQNFSKRALKNVILRLSIILLPILIFFIAYYLWINSYVDQSRFASSFIPQISLRFESISDGNWQLLLYPFASFGSMFLYGEFWNFFGNINTQSFPGFISNFITRPMVIFSLSTIFLMWLISKKPVKLILTTLIPVLIFAIIIFWMNYNWQFINKDVRIHFDVNLLGMPAIFGFFILALSFSIFLAWLRLKDEKGKLLMPLFLGPAFTFLFILFTWLGSDIQLIFMGPQRYLTIPAIGTSLFMGALIVLLYNSLKNIKFTKHFAWLIFFALIPLILINAKVTREFFDYELKVVGMDGTEQTRMKNKFWSLFPNISSYEPSLFYFDETTDPDHGYFNESTIMAGFTDWIQFDQGQTILKNAPDPGMLRTSVQCPRHTHANCLEILKKSFVVNDGMRGFLYKDPTTGPQIEPVFYNLENFYALRFIQKDLVDIRGEVLKELQINE